MINLLFAFSTNSFAVFALFSLFRRSSAKLRPSCWALSCVWSFWAVCWGFPHRPLLLLLVARLFPSRLAKLCVLCQNYIAHPTTTIFFMVRFFIFVYRYNFSTSSSLLFCFLFWIMGIDFFGRFLSGLFLKMGDLIWSLYMRKGPGKSLLHKDCGPGLYHALFRATFLGASSIWPTIVQFRN